MNKRKSFKGVLILSILLIFLVIGAASATDTEDIISDSNSTEEIITSQDDVEVDTVVAVDEESEMLSNDGDSETGSFTELEQYINDNKGYKKTIYLEKNYTYDNDIDNENQLISNGIFLTTFVNIDGKGHTINANNNPSIFYTIGKQITLKNIIFKNTNTNAITIDSTDVNIINCTFENCSDKSIQILDSGLNCVIENSDFKNSGHILIYSSSCYITKCTFVNNSANDGGAINIQSESVLIENCEFINNTANNGGAIYFYCLNNGLYIKNSTFKRNNAVTGGAIYSSSLYLLSYYTDPNYVYTNMTINLDGVTFDRNIAVNNPSLYANITNVIGDYSITSESYFDSLDKLIADTEDGKILNLNGEYKLTKGPIMIYNKNITIDGQNTTTINANGNQIFNLYDSSVTFKNINFTNAYAKNGAAIYIAFQKPTNNASARNSVYIINCNFINNTATDMGGAIYRGNDINLIIVNSTFQDNTALRGGALGVWIRADFNLTNVKFERNNATYGGAIIYANSFQEGYGNNNNFNNVSFINNTAVFSSAIYFITFYSTTFTNSTFRNNSAYDGLSNYWDKITLNNCDNSSNIIIPSIYSYFSDKTKTKITLPRGNYTISDAITLWSNLEVDGNGSIIYGNSITVFNTPIDDDSLTLTIKNFIFDNASITFDSYLRPNKVTVTNCTFRNIDGYGITDIWGGTLNNITFENCTHIIYSTYYFPTINNITIDGKNYENDISQVLKKSTTWTYGTSNKYIKITPGNYTSFSTFPIIGANITIDGQGSNITSIFGDTIFRITNKGNTTITLKNFNIFNTQGNAILFQLYNYIDNYDVNYYVDNVNITNCNANGINSNANLIVSNSNFNNCTRAISINLLKNGAIENCTFKNVGHPSIFGGAIHIGQDMNITNCQFTNCIAMSGAGIFQNSPTGTVTVSKSTFDGCKAYSTGGAIYCEGTLIITDSEFANNTADSCGGFISGNTATLTNTNFTDNNATLGGAGSVDGDNAIISNCTFINNTAMVGGGLNIQGSNATIQESSFINNTATAVSSALQISGDGCVLTGCTVEGSTAPDCAVIKIEGNSANVTECTFKDNTATNVNGTMLTVNGNGTKLEQVNLTGNNGQGITINGNDAIIKDNNIQGNNGTGITVNGNGTEVSGTNVTGNNGNAVVVNGDDVVFSENTVGGNNGTAIIINGNNATVENTEISNNNGDGIIVNGNSSQVSDILISGNNGTAMTINGNGATVENTTATNNNGSGIVVNGGNATVTSAVVSNNTGSGIELNTNDTIIANNTVENNTAGDIVKGTKLNVVVTPESIIYGANVVITVNVTDVNSGSVINEGTIYIIINGKVYKYASVVNNTATFTISGLNAGVNNITVLFNESTNFGSSNSDANVTVAKQSTSIAAKSASYVITYGGTYSVTLNTKLAGQTIVFTINGKSYKAVTNSKGVASIKLTKSMLKSAGTKTITISYSGSTNYAASKTTAKITVNKETVKWTGKAVKKTYKTTQTKKIKLVLKNSKGKALSGKFKVTLKVNKKLKGSIGKKLKKGKVFTVKFKKGVGYITLNAKKVKFSKKGTYKFTATNKGNSLYKAAAKKINMKIK